MAKSPKTTKPVSPGHSPPHDLKPLFFLAWLLCAIFYFFQYAVRSAPGVMQKELTAAWGGNHIGAMISAYYVAYAVMALVAGVLLDRYGARRTIPYGISLQGRVQQRPELACRYRRRPALPAHHDRCACVGHLFPCMVKILVNWSCFTSYCSVRYDIEHWLTRTGSNSRS